MSSSRDVNQDSALRDEAIDTDRYVAAVRRSAVPIVAIVVLWTLGTWAVSLYLPPTFKSTGEVIVLAGQGAASDPVDSDAINRELGNLQALVTTSSVLQPAARQLGTTVEDLRGHVTASVQGQTSILVVTASGRTAGTAQGRANAVVDALIEQRRESERVRLEGSIRNLTAEIIALQRAGNLQQGQTEALVQRRAELTVAAATAGDNLQAGQQAELPSAPASPRPLRNTVIAFFVSLSVAVLLAVARDRRRGPPPARGRRAHSSLPPDLGPMNGTTPSTSATEDLLTPDSAAQGVENDRGTGADTTQPPDVRPRSR